jgi:hypothetical protein
LARLFFACEFRNAPPPRFALRAHVALAASRQHRREFFRVSPSAFIPSLAQWSDSGRAFHADNCEKEK